VSDAANGAALSSSETRDPQAPTSIEATDMSVSANVAAIRADIALLAADIAKLANSVALARASSQSAACNAVREQIRARPLAAAVGIAAFGYALGRRGRPPRRRAF
jgi:hypothetical protein